MIDKFHFLLGKALFGTMVGATVDDDEPKNCDIKQNREQCIESQREMLSFPSSSG